MAEEVITRAWGAEDLAKIGKDNNLTTLFMNQVNFDKQTIKLYPYGIRKFFAASYPGGEARFYGTDEKAAAWFFQQRFGVKPEKVIEISEVAFSATKPLTTLMPVKTPKLSFSGQLVDFPNKCFNKEPTGVVIGAMETAIRDTDGRMRLFRENPMSAEVRTSQLALANRLGKLKLVRDNVAQATICIEREQKKERELVKPPKKAKGKTPEKPTRKSPVKPKKPVAPPPKEEYTWPYARVTNKEGKLLRYEDATGKPMPKELWPAQK